MSKEHDKEKIAKEAKKLQDIYKKESGYISSFDKKLLLAVAAMIANK